MSISASTLILPAPDASWLVWKPRASNATEAVESLSSASLQGKAFVVGLPASACRTLGLVLPQADHDVMSQLIAAQLEKKGIDGSPGGRRCFRWHLLGQIGSQSVVSVDVLASPFPEMLAVEHASDYTAALRLAQLPPSHLVIVEEQGDLVLAASYQGRLFHSHVFAQRPASGQDVAREVLLSRLSLEAELGSGTITGVTLVGNWESGASREIQTATGLPVQVVDTLPPNAQLDSRNWEHLLPPSVQETREAKARRAKLIRYGILAAMFYASLMFFGWAYLHFQDQNAARLQEQIEATTAPATAVKQTAQRWKAMAPALEHDRYPMVLLAEVTKLMPPSGIVLRQFEVKGDSIEIRGDARGAEVASQFIEDVKKNRALGRYAWNMPPPTVRDSKVASFRATGKLQ